MDAWFQQLVNFFNATGSQLLPDPRAVSPNQHTPISKLLKAWIFSDIREFYTAAEKRTYVTMWNGTKLLEQEWPKWTAGRFDEILATRSETARESIIQFQNVGGLKSKFYQNSLRKDFQGNAFTALSWRNSSVLSTMDCFYNISVNRYCCFVPYHTTINRKILFSFLLIYIILENP